MWSKQLVSRKARTWFHKYQQIYKATPSSLITLGERSRNHEITNYAHGMVVSGSEDRRTLHPDWLRTHNVIPSRSQLASSGQWFAPLLCCM